MKKIMKKALSLMLALVMVFALAPMTADAATGDSEAPETLVADGSVYTSEYTNGGSAHLYTYTPSANGTLTLKAECDNVYVTIEGPNVYSYIDYNPTAGYEVETAEVAVVAGTTYSIAAMTSSFSAGTVKFSASFVEGEVASGPSGDSLENAIDLTGKNTLSVPARSTKYFYVTGMFGYGSEYTLTLNGGIAAGMGGGIAATTYINGMQVATATEMQEITMLAVGSMGGKLYFSVTNPAMFDYEAVSFSVAEGAPVVGGPGSEGEPIELEVGETEENVLDGNKCWYTWTATETGTFTLTLLNNLCADGWSYQVGDNSPYSTAWDEDDKNVYEVSVTAGDVVKFAVWVPKYLADYEAYDAYEPGTGTLYFSTSFTAGSVDDDNDDDINDDNDDDNTPTEGEIIPGEGDANYAQSTAPIVVGENTLTVSNDYTYTVFVFEPTEVGAYTLTSDDSVMGIVGYHWVTDSLVNAETVSEDTIEWECTSVGQSIYVAVCAETNVANINVTKDELVVDEIPEIDYADDVMEKDPAKYTFDGEVDALKPVIYVAESTAPVKGTDGYYHLVPADEVNDEGEYIGDGKVDDYPVILVKLNDPTVSLATAIAYGDVVYVSYDENDKAEYIVSFYKAIEKYVAAADTDAKLYPLTDDLIYMMVMIGETQNWYGETGYVTAAFENDGIAEGDLMTFAMYYMEKDATGPVEQPDTGDSSNIALWVAVLGLGVVAIAGSVVMKKREF